MQTTRILALLLSLSSLLFCSTSRAANIVWVSDNPATTLGFSGRAAGFADDVFTTNILAAHNVIRYNATNDGAILLSPDDLNALNTNDLIILGRSMGSGPFGGNQGIQWNTNIYKPLICQSPFLTRPAQLGWFVGTLIFNGPPMPLTVVNPNDPEAAYLFAGGTLIGGTNTSGNYDEPLDQNTSQTSDAPVAGGNILALGLNTNKAIVEFPAGTAVRGGTNGGYRLFVASSTREVTGVETAGKDNLTPIGEAIFLRAVNLALNNGVAPNLGQTPAITTQPANLAACAGLPASLSVLASGQDPLRYQWFFNTTTPVVGGTNATLSFNPLNDTHVGTYEVVVSNVIGTITSDVVNVTLTGTGVVASAVGNQSICPGAPVTFTTTATGAGTLHYIWRKGATIVQDSNTLNSSSYTIAAVVPADGGAYSVTVENDCNSVSNNFTLTVIVTPTISAQPQNQTTPMGNGAVFGVTATTGGGTLSYHWQTNGVAVANGGGVSGATSASLAISNLALALNGLQVQVTVSNCTGTILSSIATLTVTPITGISFDFNTPGQFTNAPYHLFGNNWMDSTINSGGFNNPFQTVLPFEVSTGGVGVATGSGALDLAFNNGTDRAMTLLPVTYDFSLPGKTLIVSITTKIKVPTAANRRAIQMAFVTTTNVANVWQHVQGNNGQGFMSAILQNAANNTVTPAYHLRAQHKVISGTATTEQTPINNPTNLLATNTWYRFVAKFVNIEDVTANNFYVESYLQDMGLDGITPGAIVLAMAPQTNVNADIVNSRNLLFSIRAFEDGGNDYFDNIQVATTTGAASFVSPPASQTILENRKATFQALVDGDGPYTYQWNSNGVPIPGAAQWDYTTRPLGAAASGSLYSVTVTTTNGSVTSGNATVTVTADALDVLSVGSVEGSVIGLRFDQAVNKATAETAANYTINGTPAVAAQLRDFTAVFPRGIDQKLLTNLTEVLLTPLSPVSGTFTVAVANVTSLSGVALSGNNTAVGEVAGLAGFDVDPISQINGQPGTTPGYNYSFAPGQFEIAGGGYNIFNTFDAFRFVYKQVTGDFDVKVRVPYIDLVRTAEKGGFDARVSLDAFSPHAGAFANPMLPARNFIEGGMRQNWNQATVGWGNQPVISYPNVWLRFRRSGNTFIRYSSSNGVNWQCDGQITPNPAFPATIHVGFAVCANLEGNTVHQLATTQFDSYGAFGGYPGATIAITSNPPNATVNAGSSGTLAVSNTVSGGTPTIPTSAGEVTYLWQRSNGVGGWTNMPTAGGTNNTVNTGTLYINDNGAQYRAILSAPGVALSVTSTVATVTVNDAAAPTFSTVATIIGNSFVLVVNFNEPLSATALNPANYTVTNLAGTVFGISNIYFLNGDQRAVVLILSNAISGNLGVVASGLQDLNGNTIVTVARQASVFQIPTTPIIVEHYGNLATTADLSALTNDVKFTAGLPDYITFSNLFGVNAGAGFPTGPENYGTKTWSYFVPPVTDRYTFWLRGDDFLRLFINTNISAATSTNPVGRIMGINMGAANANYATANSYVSPPLNAGQAYYLEVLMKETGGGDGMALTIRQGTSTTVPPQAETAGLNFFRYPDAAAPPHIVVGMEFYLGPTGDNTAALVAATNTAAYQTRSPSFFAYGKQFSVSREIVQTGLENYLGRMYTYFIPPTNGNYKFWVRSDDASQLLMNTSSNPALSTDPAGATLIGQLGAFTAAYTAVAQNLNLVGGQRYYLEGRWKEGTGGDGMYVAVRAQSDATPPAGTDTIPAAFLQFPTNLVRVVPSSSIGAILPLNPTITDGQRIVFRATNVIEGGGLVWFKNGQQLQTGATLYNTDPLTLADDGAVFSLLVTNGFSSFVTTSRVTVLPDVTAPTILSAVASQYGDSVLVTFNELVDPLTAGCLANYSIAGLTVYGVDVDEIRGNRVYLRTSAHTLGAPYTLIVTGVRDRSGVGNATAGAMQNFTAWGFGGKGALLVEIFTNIPGGSVDNLLSNPRYIDNLPDVTYYTNAFVIGQYNAIPNGGNSLLDNYGARISGLFMPPSNGLYRLFLRSDDGSRLYMNTNGPSATERVLIAQNDAPNPSLYVNGVAYGRAGANASPILSLSAGTPYYLEALLKEGGGGDYLVVHMKPIDATTLTEIGGLFAPALGDQISGGFFSAHGNPDINQFLISSQPPAELFLFANDPVFLELVANTIPVSLANFVSYQWQKTNTATGTFTNIPGATSSSLFFFATLDDDEATYRLVASIPGKTIILPTLLHVDADTVPPYIVSVSSLEGNTIGVHFDGPVDVGIAQEPSGYFFDVPHDGIVVSTATLKPGDPTRVLLTLDPLSVGFPVEGDFTLYNGFMKDLAGNEAFDLFATGAVQRLKPQDIFAVAGTGTAPGTYNTLLPGSTWTDTNGGFDIFANGRDIWETADGMHFAYREVTGNFDVKARVQKLVGADQWSKAGIMARGSTNAGSRNIFMMTTPTTTPIPGQLPNNLYGFQWRDIDGAASAGLNGTSTNPPAYPNAWLRLQRSNSVFYGYRSSNGVDWVAQAFRDTSSNLGGAFPDTMLLGLATTSHDFSAGHALDHNAYAEYRDLYFPAGAVITAQPEPTETTITIGINQSVTFSNLVATGNLQWRRNGVAIPGATADTFTIPDTGTADSGTYTVSASTDGGGQISSNIYLIVTNQILVVTNDSLTATQNVAYTFPSTLLTGNDFDPEGDPLSILAVYSPHTIATNFNAGNLIGATRYGTAHHTNNQGVGGSGALVLNPTNINSQGSLVINPVVAGARVHAFTATFNIFIGNYNATEPADGFSFNFATNIPNANVATPDIGNESGIGNGFSFSIDQYRFLPFQGLGSPIGNGPSTTANSSGMKINYGGFIVAAVQCPTFDEAAGFVPVSITVTLDGKATVFVNGTNVFGTVTLPGYAPSAGRFGLFARSGGAYETHIIDDLNIDLLSESSARGGLLTQVGSDITYTPPTGACGTDSFYYLVSDGQFDGTNAGFVTVNILTTNGPSITTCVPNQNVSVDALCTALLPDLRSQLVVADCGNVTVIQDPAPGTSLALGVPVVVTFSVTNTSGFGTNCQATITAVDTTAPVAVCPGNITAEATGPSGAAVSFSISGTDNCTVSSVVANPASGSTFALGVTTVTVTATDGAGNTNACTFTVTVRDTTAPSFICPANQLIACTATNGAIATYGVSPTDAVDPAPTVIFSPISGSTFPVGTNAVLVTVYDAAGNTNTCAFSVVVEDQTPAKLTITKVDTNAIVCWPQTCTTYTLESTTNLNPPIAWAPVGLPVDVAGTNYCVTVPIAGPGTNTFFRLYKP